MASAPSTPPSHRNLPDPLLKVSGTRLETLDGTPVRLRGAGLGGWMNMENFITGYPSSESAMRSAVREVLGERRYQLFFDRLLTVFFDEADAALLASKGVNCLRLPVNYRHFEDDARPLEIREEGFAQLDRVVELCGRHGIYTVIDLHSLPGAQNHQWHSDNPTHLPSFWDHRHFQDRVVHLWEVMAERYKDNPWVAGYNPINEPADESGHVLPAFYDRLVAAIRSIDPHHILFLDGNRYSTEFDLFGEPIENTVYTCHDYARAGFARTGGYPGHTDGIWVDKEHVEDVFLRRTAYMRKTGTPIWVGEFGPVYTGDPARDEVCAQLLADQLEIYRRHEASWSVWTYKDVGLQGLVHLAQGSPYQLHFAEFMAKKHRLGAEAWSSPDGDIREAAKPLEQLVTDEFPSFTPYPFGTRQWIEIIIRHVLLGQPLVQEYAELFRGLGDDDLLALADSFALEHCVRRDWLLDALANG
ncbi:glycoside hydrolase family 5 protein [Streptomyces canus]|uniref:glycoside hydrolase family 5 protein n=1 Tax=Streptomyces canus TaxID=58343 RepID=UPI002DD8FC62|nr:glycoside hydrolase family 5 protein [Streptomyces canus]WSD91703.1 glycoside hydrolase family 5 protein [Streptomyces canus]